MKTVAILTSCVAMLAPSPKLFADDDTVNLAAYPTAVQQAIQANLQGGKLDEIKTVRIDGRTLYKVEVDLKRDRDLNLYIGGDGQIMKTRKEIALSAAPKVVRDAAKAVGGKIEEIEEVVSQGTTTYLVELEQAGDREIIVEFSETGAILSQRIDD